MAQIQLEALTKTYAGAIRAVDNVNLTVASGEWLALVGPSGCGKTTALRLIAGLEMPTSGSILIGGQTMTGVPPGRRDITMLFQRPALFPNRTVLGNILFGMKLRQNWPHWLWRRNDKSALRGRETARLLKIDEILDRYPAELSGGEQQRVALGRAITRQAAVGLLDEPFGNLDAPLRRKFLHELPLLRDRFPTTMIIVTHDPAEAFALGDRVAVMQAGRLVQVASPAELRRTPVSAFVADLVRWTSLPNEDGR